MSELNQNWKYEHNDINASYNDIKARNFQLKANPLILGYEAEFHPKPKSIDLRAKHDHTIGIEVEGSYWIGNFWDNPGYNHLTELDFKTVNMPLRKEKYYIEEYTYVDDNGKTITVDNREMMNKVEFFRWNWDGSQVIRVIASVVQDPEKMFKTRFRPNNKNSEGPEKWMSFKYEDSITYNEQADGSFVSDRDPNGKYVELSEDEIKKQRYEVAVKKAEIAAEKTRRALERAKERAKEEERKRKLGKSLNIVERREIARMTVPSFDTVLPKKKDLDNLDIPQYETQKEEYFKKHPKINN